jgi:hypothetical protein
VFWFRHSSFFSSSSFSESFTDASESFDINMRDCEDLDKSGCDICDCFWPGWRIGFDCRCEDELDEQEEEQTEKG